MMVGPRFSRALSKSFLLDLTPAKIHDYSPHPDGLSVKESLSDDSDVENEMRSS